MASKQIRETDTDLRDEAVYQHYLRVLKELGGRARFMNKVDIYMEAGEPFFIGTATVSRIVRKNLLDRKKFLDNTLHKKLKENTDLALDAIRKAKEYNKARKF